MQVTVSLDTLTSTDQAPGQLHGHGPITASAACDVADWPRITFRRPVIDRGTGRLLHLDPATYQSTQDLAAHAHDPPTGPDLRSPGCYSQEADHGGTTRTGRHPDPYTPSAAQARYVCARDPVCSFPTCHQPAYRCELDHTIEYAKGGATCPCNLRPACKRHHQLKTKKLWQVANHADGSWTWTSPSRRRYHSPPHDHSLGY